MNIVRLGLAGVGRWGRNYVRTIATMQNARLVAVASRNHTTAELVPSECVIFDNWRDLVEHDGIDAVIVATPPRTHAEIAIAALRNGKAVLVEKPLTMDLAEALAIRRAAEECGRPVMVEHTHLFHPAFSRLRTEVAAEGSVRGIRSSAGNRGPYRPDVPVLWDWAPHDIAMCLALFGNASLEVKSAVRLDSRLIDGIAAERVRLELLAGQDIPVTTAISTLDDRHRWFAVDFDARTLIYSDLSSTPLVLCDEVGAIPDGTGTPIAVEHELPLTAAVRAFVTLVASGAHADGSLSLGIRVVECLARCAALLESG